MFGRATRLIAKSAFGKYSEEWKKFGINVADSNGNIRNMIDVIEDLEKSMKGMSDEQRIAHLEGLGFAALAQKAILPLIGMSGAMREYESELKNATGTTMSVANKQMESFWATTTKTNEIQPSHSTCL